jgi:hypothetical protein
MAASVSLPGILHKRLRATARRIRLLRALHGLSLLVLVLTLTGATAVLVDFRLGLPADVRQVLFTTWLGVSFLMLCFGVLLPQCRRLDAAAIAALIEQTYPELGERLTSSVELARTPSEGHGSPALIALLMEETAKQSHHLDFRPAVSARRAGVLTVLAACAVTLAEVPAFLWPDEYAELTQRFFLPWRVPAPVVPFTFTVTPGDTVAARGRPVTLSVRLVPRNDLVTLPGASTLVVRDSTGKETRQAMETAGAATFRIDYKVPGDVQYRVEAGELTSDLHRITAVTPVDLAAESPTITITPPAYARATLETDTFHGLADLSALQHSEVRFDFRFSRPAVAAYLEWITSEIRSGKEETRTQSHVQRQALALSEDRLEATFTLPAEAPGSYRLVMEAEHGIRTERDGGTLTIKPDQPPVVLKFAGKEDLRAVLPSDRIPLQLRTADDIAITEVELEYRINEGEPVTEAMKLEGAGTREAVAQQVFALSGKVREEDRVHFRFRVTDNLPKEFGGPHVIQYPADHWLTLQVARRGDPLRQQEILAQRDEISRRLEAIRQALLQEKQGVAKVQEESRRQPSLQPEQAEQVKQLQKDNQANQKTLQELAQTASTTPALQGIAERVQDVAGNEMKESQEALDHAAEKESTPQGRSQQFEKANEQLGAAVQRLEELKKANEKAAQERLDQAKVQELAEREKELAERAAELAAQKSKDESTREQLDKLKQEQARVAAELEQLTKQSEPLRQALEQAREEQMHQLAQRARELAEAERDLAKAETETEQNRNKERLGDLAHKQEDLAEQMAKFSQQTQQAARSAKSKPLQAEEAQKAAEALKQGDSQDALRRQDQTAYDLERLANDLERAARLADDPRQAAQQLARAEEGLRQRVAEEMGKKNEAKPLADRLQALKGEQEALAHAAENLSVPPNQPELQGLKKQVAEQSAEAARSLAKQDGERARAQMEQARQKLERLAEQLPSLAQRRQQAQRDLARLRRQQEEVARQVEHIRKTDADASHRLAEAARQQAEVAEALSKMDAPNQQARQGRAAEALNRALADLMDARPEDVAASQQEARRQLDRLEQALRGEKPADERVRELAQQQRELAQEAARAAADPNTTQQQQKEIQRRQLQLAKEAQVLSAPEAPQRLEEAASAALRAAQTAYRQPTARDTQQQMQESARKLDELARQMAGQESDAERAQRLAQRQAEAAIEAEREVRFPTGTQPSVDEQRRQRDIAQEASQVRGGEEGRAEKQRVTEAVRRAMQAAGPQERARAERELADALRDLADRLNGRSDPAGKAGELARAQRELAQEAANPEGGRMTPKELRKLADRQAELAHQMERVERKDAGRAGQEAVQKMAEAQQALEQARTQADARDALARAVEATEQLAQQLGKAQADLPQRRTSAKPAEQSPRQQAQKLAQQQRELAESTRQMKPGQLDRDALEKAAQMQQALNQQASQLPANQAQKGLEQARAAMNEARQALQRNDSAQAQQKQNEAAQALARLAEKLPAQAQQAGPSGPQDNPAAQPSVLPTRQQSEQARQLARQQRELREAVRHTQETARNERPTTPLDGPVADLVRQQTEVARQTAELARGVEKEQGQDAASTQQARQAQQTTQQAARQMQAGALPQAQKSGLQAADHLRKLAGQLAQMPRREADPTTADPLQQARQLGQRQEEINRRLAPLANDTQAQAAQQQAQQKNLQQQAGELSQELSRQAEQSSNSSEARSSLQKASQSSQQAQQAMKQAQSQAQQGNQRQAQQSQSQAAQSLEQASQQTAQAASQQMASNSGKPRQPSGQKPEGEQSSSSSGSKPGGTQPGQAVQQAQQQMARAGEHLGQGQPSQAQTSMQQAAQALQQIARQMGQHPGQQQGQSSESNEPNGDGRTGGGPVDLHAFGLEKTPYAGKTWGELPGDLRTKIVQDMKGRYGDDYARMIKLYFEQIASTNLPANPSSKRPADPSGK